MLDRSQVMIRLLLREAMMAEVMKHQRAEQGEIIMPAWSQKVLMFKPHLEDLYAYLKARSDGVFRKRESQKWHSKVSNKNIHLFELTITISIPCFVD